MELGQRLKQARQEAGLSQRQLCGDTITRNMLSQIENGSARPSMDSLAYFAQRLGKPISFFLEESPIELPNQGVMEQARAASGVHRLKVLEQYQSPDAVYDPERWLLEMLACMDLAQQALEQEKTGYARELLLQAKAAGQKSHCCTPELERRRLLLCYRAGMTPERLVEQLPELDTELLLRAQAALNMGQHQRALALLEATEEKSSQWFFLQGQALEAQAQYTEAVQAYMQAEGVELSLLYSRLERCFEALGDYKQAYEYACKQRQL